MSERCMNCLKIKHFGRICEHCGHDSKGNLSLHVLPEGVLLAGQYLVGRVLGQGGFGITYYGYDQLLDMPVAIKEFYPDGVVNRNNEFGNDLRILPEMEEYYNTGKRRFLREAKAVLKLMHVPQVVRLHRYFEENNTAYIVMEYVEGVSLRKFVDNLNRNMSMDEVLKLLGPLMESMDQMHDQGLIHRDISPDNIMIQPDNTPKLLDFGAVRQVVRPNAAKGLSNPTAAILKKGFAPPEQYQSQGALGPWTDVYGFAATIYYCMAGKAPVESIVRLADNVPVDWAAMGAVGFSQLRAMKKGLALKATERTPSVGQLYENLMKQDIPRPKGKKPVILAAAAAAVLLAALGLTTLGGNDNNERLTVVTESTATQTTHNAFADEETSGTETRGTEREETKPDTDREGDSGNGGSNGDVPRESVPETVPETAPETKPSLVPPIPNPTSSAPVPGEDGHNVLTINVDYEGNDDERKESYAFGTKAKRKEVYNLILLSSRKSAPDDAVDASEMHNGSVLAWVKENGYGYDLYLAADGDIFAPANSRYLFADMINLKSIQGSVRTENVTDMWGMFTNDKLLVTLDLSRFDTSSVTRMGSMFYGCIKLEYVDIGSFDTRNVTSMYCMFYHCENLTELDLSHFNTAKVSNMQSMFNGCKKLKELDISSFQTGKVTTMKNMFFDCNGLTSLDLSHFDTGNVTDMASMFQSCDWLKSLNLSGFDTGNVTDMSRMFSNCSSLEKLNLKSFKTPKLETMEEMFYNCTGLKTVDLSGMNITTVKNMKCTFYQCEGLKVTIGTFNFRNVPKDHFDHNFMPDSGMINDRYWRSWFS